MDNGKQGETRDTSYLTKTLRSTFVVALFITLVLVSYQQTWVIGPMWIGLSLAIVLLWGWERFVRGVFTPEALRREKNKKKNDLRWALVAFALVKYPLVGLLLWYLVRLWHDDMPRWIAFVGGFVLLHFVIALRAVGKLLTDKS